MKAIPLLLAAATLVSGTRKPTMEWDPDTVKSCVEWYNNGMDETCEYIRDLFGITPEQFTKWNPSVGLDCKPWRLQSYCIVTQERLDNTTKTTTTTSRPSTTTVATSTLGPSPTAWTALGCYNESSTRPILGRPMSGAGGDAALTIPKCQDICYRVSLRFAGVKEGNQCWCSHYVGGEFAKNTTECNLPCSGDKKTICGGKDRLNIFRAEAAEEKPPAPKTISSSSGAIRNIAMF